MLGTQDTVVYQKEDGNQNFLGKCIKRRVGETFEIYL